MKFLSLLFLFRVVYHSQHNVRKIVVTVPLATKSF